MIVIGIYEAGGDTVYFPIVRGKALRGFVGPEAYSRALGLAEFCERELQLKEIYRDLLEAEQILKAIATQARKAEIDKEEALRFDKYLKIESDKIAEINRIRQEMRDLLWAGLQSSERLGIPEGEISNALQTIPKGEYFGMSPNQAGGYQLSIWRKTDGRNVELSKTKNAITVLDALNRKFSELSIDQESELGAGNKPGV